MARTEVVVSAASRAGPVEGGSFARGDSPAPPARSQALDVALPGSAGGGGLGLLSLVQLIAFPLVGNCYCCSAAAARLVPAQWDH